MDRKNNYLNPLSASMLFITIFLMFIAFILLYTEAYSILGVDDKPQNPLIIDTIVLDQALDYNNLSSLAAKYESNGNAGTIANNAGDPGGKSYGVFQLASSRGSAASFLIWLYDIDRSLYTRLINAKNSDGGYGKSFDATWKLIAQENQSYFYTLQYNYFKGAYLDPVIEHFKSHNIDFSKRTKTIQNVIWSTSTQHGVYGAIGLINKLNLNLSSDLADDINLIKSIYAERRKVNIYFVSCSQNIKNSVYNRFISEEKDALAMIKKELGG